MTRLGMRTTRIHTRARAHIHKTHEREAHRALMVAGDWEGRQSMSRSLRAPKAVWQRFRCSHSEPDWAGMVIDLIELM